MTYSLELFPETLSQYVSEPIDMDCEFIVARNGTICGAAGVNFIKESLPRFEHIIVHPKYQKTSLGGRLMFKVEEMLKQRGFDKYLAFIYKDNTLMRDYALKFGFNLYKTGNRGDWYIKAIAIKEVTC